MILIGENIHIISKTVREALLNRDEKFINDLIVAQQQVDYIDLNIGPAKGQMENIFSWIIENNKNIKISFDTTNTTEMKNGLNAYSNNDCFINSISYDEPRMSEFINLALAKDCNLVALTMSKEKGIPKTADERLELAFNIYEKCIEAGLNSEKLFFDPLILPISIEQTQAQEALNTIKMLKESFEHPIKTIIGLSNISNGCPTSLRPLINRVFAVLAYGAGLDAAIIDAKDSELIRIIKMLERNTPQNNTDELYINLSKMVENFEDISSISYDTNCSEQSVIIKTAEILLNNKIYSESYTKI